MKEATFYILNKTNQHDRYLFACRLAEKAVHQSLSMVISISSSELAQHIDGLLWNYKPDSFLPHDLKTTNQDSNVSYLITVGIPREDSSFDISLNLDHQANCNMAYAARHIEIAIQDKDMLNQLRQAYKQLQHNNIPVEVHDFTKSV